MPGRAGANPRAAQAQPPGRVLGEEPRLLVGAQFVASAATIEQLPPPELPEVAFAGRSNAGKSSAINALTGRRGLAFVSKLPGRTQLVNLFHIPAGLSLVDLPGYGYSRVAAEIRERWQPLLENYLARRPSLVGVVLMMDVRHPLGALDIQLIEWLSAAGRRVHILLTKSDKLGRSEATRTLAAVEGELARFEAGGTGRPTVQLFSSARRTGIRVAERVIAHWVGLREDPQEKEDP